MVDGSLCQVELHSSTDAKQLCSDLACQPEVLMSLFSSRPRSRVAVVLLSILMVPLGMLYLGRPVRAGVYLGLTILSVPVACLLAIGGVWPAGVSFAVPGYAVALVGIADAAQGLRFSSASPSMG